MARYHRTQTKITAMLPTFPTLSKRLSDAAEIRRVEALYERLPAGTVTTMIAILAACAVLFDSVSVDWLKAWAAFMLSGAGMQVWLWAMFRSSEKQIATIGRWEWMFSGGVFITSLGWAALAGPLFPKSQESLAFVSILLLMLGVTGSALLASSKKAYWTFLTVALLPMVAHFVLLGQSILAIAAGISSLVVLLLVQQSLYQFIIENLQHNAEADSLLTEQQAIFESSPMGIAVISGQELLKCNARLGELLGRSLAEMVTVPFHAHFVSEDEVQQFLNDSEAAFAKEHPAQGIYRLRRADKSQFWAEIFGRRMPGNTGQSGNTVWMIADVTMRVARQSSGK